MTNVSSLGSLPQLAILDLSSNRLADLQSLSRLTQITSLDLARNPITNYTAIATLTNLTGLRLSGNSLASLDFAQGLTTLQSLTVDHNQLGNLNALAGLTNLHYLDASYNLLTNISALQNIPVPEYYWSSGFSFDFTGNLLDLAPGSLAMTTIQYLLFGLRAQTASYQPQSPATFPTVSIVFGPGSGARIANNAVQIGGTASDDVQVASVEWQLVNANGATDWQTASGTTIWSATVSGLAVGQNTVNVRAHDSSDNTSPVVSRSFVLLTPLVININGCGTVSPDGTGISYKEAGQNYTLNAAPCRHYKFVGWSGGVSSTSPTFSFTMRPGLVIQADFEQLAFTPESGNYYGLFYDTNGVTAESSGAISLSTTSKGTFSGKLRIENSVHLFSGRLDTNREAKVSIARPDMSSLTLHLEMDLSPGAPLVTGTLSDGAWTADLIADRAVFDQKTTPAPQAGRYNFVIAPVASYGPGSSDLKESGSGKIFVEKSGRAQLTGTLSDRTRFSASGIIGADGQLALYVPLYKGEGMVLSWIRFADSSADDLNGAMIWSKPAIGRSGKAFTVQTTISGQRYTHTASGRVEMP